MPFTFQQTADGSLTTRVGESETMHSLRGAFSETLYIYGSALDRSLSLGLPMATLSMGLGLGYIEILAAAHAVKHSYPLCGRSFEIVPALISSFEAWLNSADQNGQTVHVKDSTQEIPFHVYDGILVRTAEALAVSERAIRSALDNALADSRWILDGAMTPATTFSTRFTTIAFDAFSSKSTPELWSREFLDPFLRDACAESCVLSTYACTGHLKRALVDAGFKLEIREGYASKRDSTLAVR